jgi:hypothetical protein
MVKAAGSRNLGTERLDEFRLSYAARGAHTHHFTVGLAKKTVGFLVGSRRQFFAPTGHQKTRC